MISRNWSSIQRRSVCARGLLRAPSSLCAQGFRGTVCALAANSGRFDVHFSAPSVRGPRPVRCALHRRHRAPACAGCCENESSPRQPLPACRRNMWQWTTTATLRTRPKKQICLLDEPSLGRMDSLAVVPQPPVRCDSSNGASGGGIAHRCAPPMRLKRPGRECHQGARKQRPTDAACELAPLGV